MKIFIGVAHTPDTPGKKCAGFVEYEWSKEICERLKAQLEAFGFNAEIVYQKTFYGPSQGLKQPVDDINRKASKDDIAVFIHSNAMGTGAETDHPANYFSVFTAESCSKKSTVLAEDYIWAVKQRLIGTRVLPVQKKNFYVIKNTKCPAILTENGFYTNKKQREWLMSETGKQAIVDIHIDCIVAFIQKGL